MRKKTYSYCRRIRTKQERTVSFRDKEFCRPKRRSWKLNPWDLERVASTWNDKCWKSKRKTQYHPVELRKFEISFTKEEFNNFYNLEDYLRDHNIGFQVESITESEYKMSHYLRKMRKYVRVVGYRVIWWYNKDIGLKYII